MVKTRIQFLILVALFGGQLVVLQCDAESVTESNLVPTLSPNLYCTTILERLPPLIKMPTDEAAHEADLRVHLFIVQNKRLPKAKNPNEFSLMKVDKHRWAGGSKFRKDTFIAKRFHSDPISAWTRQLELLDMAPAFPGFSEKNKVQIRRTINGEIFRYLPLEDQRRLADRRLVEAWLEVGEVFSRNSEVWNEIGFSQARWTGSASSVVPTTHRFHQSRLEGLRATSAILETMSEGSSPNLEKIKIQVRKQIFFESSRNERREISILTIVDYILRNRKIPTPSKALSECEFDRLGLVYTSIIGKDGRALFLSAAEFYSIVAQTIVEDSRYIQLKDSDRREINNAISERIQRSNRWEFRSLPMKTQIAQTDQAIANWIYVNLRLPRNQDLVQITSPPIVPNKWLGIGKFLYKVGRLYKRALHRHPSEAWASVSLILENLPSDSHFTDDARRKLLRKIQRKIKFSRMTNQERLNWTDVQVGKYILKYGDIPLSELPMPPKNRTFREIFGVSYKKWSGTKEYSTLGKNRDPNSLAMHTDAAEAFISVREILKTIPLPEGMTEADRKARIELVDKRISVATGRFGVEWNPDDE